MLRFFRELIENVRIAAKALTGNRLRTVLSLLGIGIGVTTVIAIFAIIQGLNLSFSKQLDALGSSSVTVAQRPWILGPQNWWKYRGRPKVTINDYRALKRESVLASGVAPEVGDTELIAFGSNSVPSVQVIGSTEDFATIHGFFPKVGRFINDTDNDLRTRNAVLGMDVAEPLFGSSEAALGHTVRIGNKEYRVVGVLDRKGKLLGKSLDLMVIIPFESFRNDFGAQRDIDIAVSSADPKALDALEDEVTTILRRERGLAPGAEENFSVNRQEQFTDLYSKLTGSLYAVAFGVGLITLLVGGIGIMNIMLVSVRERTREIGVRRALGARKRTLIIQFLVESVALSMVGGGAGTVLGEVVAKMVAELTPLAAAVTPAGILLGFGFASFVGLVFGVWPAWSAANLDPVEALRYE